MTLLFFLLISCDRRNDELTFTAIHVSGAGQSGDANLLQLPNNEIVLIDTGFSHYAEDSLMPILRSLDINQIDKIIITHAHRNHYGALRQILDEFEVGTVYFNPQRAESCDREKWATGCDLKDVNEVRSRVMAQSQLSTMKQGDVLIEDATNEVTLEVLHYFSGQQKPLFNISVNDSSAVLRLTYGKTRVLFTGDIGPKIGHYLAKNTNNLEADIVTAAHHGMSATVPQKFYDKVSAKLAVVGVARVLWESDRGKETRDYFNKNGIETVVTGRDGTTRIVLDKLGAYKIEAK